MLYIGHIKTDKLPKQLVRWKRLQERVFMQSARTAVWRLPRVQEDLNLEE
jgi:hypothetical protein